jgi:outer membrane murein-binding lipoprotein Lpp
VRHFMENIKLGEEVPHLCRRCSFVYTRDEKSTLMSQITTLQGQQEMLGSRLESLTQTADSAMEREREADERLDAALSVHAKQISQRQVRKPHRYSKCFSRHSYTIQAH